jgi:2-polyprenyl-3-methyl-5-hydroxy-6-metoxy-1,4-benzoquinol methylase
MKKTWSTPVREEKTRIIPCALCGGSIFLPALVCEGFTYVRCKSCRLVQINPQPEKSEVLNRYNQMFAKDYLSYELENEDAFLKLQQLALKDSGFKKIEKKLFSHVDSKEPPRILDIGCATGALLSWLEKRGWRVTGVEISDCAGYAKNKRNLDIYSLTLEEIKFENEFFNIILASHLIEHLNDPRSFLVEVNRILKKNGRLFITTPNINGFQARITGSRWRSAIFDHLYLFSIQTIKKMLNASGFAIESRHTWGGLAAGLAPVFIKKPADFLAKQFNCGDVMIIQAKKTET